MVADQAEYIVRDCGATVAFASTPEQAAKRLKAQATSPKLKHVFVFDHAGGGGKLFASLLEEGRKAHEASPATFDERAAARKPDDLATIIYTSGTTGEPKGAMLMQSNFVSNVLSGCTILPFDGSAVALSFLPLSHVFERIGDYWFFHTGTSIDYVDSFDTVPIALQEARPTFAMSVPRLYEKMYARAFENALASGAFKKRIFFWARAVADKWADAKLAGHEPHGPLAW